MLCINIHRNREGQKNATYRSQTHITTTVPRGDGENVLQRLKLHGGNCDSALKTVKKKAELCTRTPSCVQTSSVNILRTLFLHLLVNLCVTLSYILY